MKETTAYHTVAKLSNLDIRAMARALGGNVIGSDTALVPGPGHSARDRSLTIKLDDAAPDGFVCFSHAGDDWQSCKDFIRERLGLPQWQPGDGRDRRVDPSRLKNFDRASINMEAERRERTADDLARIARARAVWDDSTDPRGTAAERYLRSRKLVLGDDAAVLRFHPACPWRSESTGATIFLPALIAAFTSIDDGAITAVHRIRVDQPERWPKADRRMLGVVHRSAVKLAPAGATLCVGEGVETALAARQLGHTPAWAAGSAGMIEHFPVLENVACLRILGERDAAGARTAEIAAQRWHGAGRRVQIVTPDVGNDLNDELMAVAP